MTGFFTAIPEGQAITYAKGVYRQVPIYERKSAIYARQGAGFVRLNAGGGTSNPNIRWAEIDAGHGHFAEKVGGFVEYLPPAMEAAE